jgi:hypothetical protein
MQYYRYGGQPQEYPSEWYGWSLPGSRAAETRSLGTLGHTGLGSLGQGGNGTLSPTPERPAAPAPSPLSELEWRSCRTCQQPGIGQDDATSTKFGKLLLFAGIGAAAWFVLIKPRMKRR